MDPSDLGAERASFHAHLAKTALGLDVSREGAGYADPVAQALWDCWLASAKACRTEPAPRSAPPGMALVKIEPSEALLASMAMRDDHALGIPGYYDQIASIAPGPASGPSHAQRLASAMARMRKLHDEVVGKGFHDPSDESFHLGILAATKAAPGGAAN